MRTPSICLALAIVLICSFASAQWVQTNGPSGGMVDALAVCPNGAGGENLFAGTWRGGVFLTSNNGTSWTQASPGVTDTSVCSLAVIGTNLFAGTRGRGVFRSTDNGTTWTAGLTNTPVYSLAVSGMNLFAGTEGGVFLSTNNGTSWTQTGLTGSYVWSLAVSPNGTGGVNLFAGVGVGSGSEYYGIFIRYHTVLLSTDSGTRWTQVDSGMTTDRWVPCLAVTPNGTGGTNIFAGGDGVFLSTNNGTSWTAVDSGLAGSTIWSLAVIGTNLFAGTDGGVFLSTNTGTSWTQTGLANTVVYSLAVLGANLFAGTAGSGVWRRPLSEMITRVDPSINELPRAFLLQQNYPNPFNPSTNINYELPKASQVSLRVYDILGREVAVLVDEQKEPGFHTATWDAKGKASGIYYCRIAAGEFHAVKTMLVLR